MTGMSFTTFESAATFAVREAIFSNAVAHIHRTVDGSHYAVTLADNHSAWHGMRRVAVVRPVMCDNPNCPAKSGAECDCA